MTKIGTMEVEVGVTLAPLDTDQTKRVLALNVAKDVLTGGMTRPSTEALLDLADYIVGPEPCPLSGLVAIALDPAPAEPEVFTVHDEEGVEALPLGSVLRHPTAGWRYVRRPKGWTNVVADYDHYPSNRLVYSTGLIVDYIPGGV